MHPFIEKYGTTFEGPLWQRGELCNGRIVGDEKAGLPKEKGKGKRMLLLDPDFGYEKIIEQFGSLHQFVDFGRSLTGKNVRIGSTTRQKLITEWALRRTELKTLAEFLGVSSRHLYYKSQREEACEFDASVRILVSLVLPTLAAGEDDALVTGFNVLSLLKKHAQDPSLLAFRVDSSVLVAAASHLESAGLCTDVDGKHEHFSYILPRHQKILRALNKRVLVEVTLAVDDWETLDAEERHTKVETLRVLLQKFQNPAVLRSASQFRLHDHSWHRTICASEDHLCVGNGVTQFARIGNCQYLLHRQYLTMHYGYGTPNYYSEIEKLNLSMVQEYREMLACFDGEHGTFDDVSYRRILTSHVVERYTRLREKNLRIASEQVNRNQQDRG